MVAKFGPLEAPLKRQRNRIGESSTLGNPVPCSWMQVATSAPHTRGGSFCANAVFVTSSTAFHDDCISARTQPGILRYTEKILHHNETQQQSFECISYRHKVAGQTRTPHHHPPKISLPNAARKARANLNNCPPMSITPV